MKPEFSQASESFKKANPHLFTISQEPVVFAKAEEKAPTRAELKSEKELQEQITGFLERNGTVVIRSRMDKKTSINVGTPDLLFSIRSRAVGFEVKLPGQKPTEQQRNMMQRMTENGWICRVVESYPQAVKIFYEISA